MTTVRQFLLQTVFPDQENYLGIKDYNVAYCGDVNYYLDCDRKASRKNARQKYLSVKALLDSPAAIIQIRHADRTYYEIRTLRTFEGAFAKELENNEFRKEIVYLR